MLATMMSQTKLLFNEDIPARTSNRAMRVSTPSVIVIEKLVPTSGEHQKNVDSNRSSFNFSVLTEESINTAVMLAKRDMRNMSLNSTKQQDSICEPSGVDQDPEKEQTKPKLKVLSSKVKTTRPLSRPLTKQTKQIHKKSPTSNIHRAEHKCTTSSFKPLVDSHKSVLGLEVCRLQNELELYVQKVEELANKEEKVEEPTDPDEEKKKQLHRERQAARSSRFIYDLQHQVKEIQDDIAKLHGQNVWETNKSTAVHRLAAAHRGTLRALHVVVQQIEDLSRGMLPPHHRHLGQLIRQLSLCSAKVEFEYGSSVPEAALNILQKLETLDSVWNKQTLQFTHVPASPPGRQSTHHSVSPHRASRGPNISNPRGRFKSNNPKRNIHARRKRSQKPQVTFSQPLSRKDALRSCLKHLVQQRGIELRFPQSDTPHSKSKAKPTTMRLDVSFHKPTVASRLRVNQIPPKEQSVPWIPTSPHSPRLGRSPERSQPEPRCLFFPEKSGQSLPKHKTDVSFGEEPAMSSEKRSQEQKEAIRCAWLDTMTERRLKELNQLSKQEGERLQRLRSDIISPTQWAERAEQKVRQRIQPLLDEVKQTSLTGNVASSSLRLSETEAEMAAERAEQLSEAILEDLLREDAAPAMRGAEMHRPSQSTTRHGQRAPTLESMLLRMEEIQRDHEEVRRRFASITYSDPQHWGRPGGTGLQSSGSRPISPQPIRITRPVLSLNPEADIVLERPLDTGVLSENGETEESPRERHPPCTRSTTFPGPAEKVATVVSVPRDTLRSIYRYREVYNFHLQDRAGEALAGYNSWAIADSLAEEFLSEAMADIAAEFQDVAEEYAEAIFTSEFLHPVRPSARVLPT